jgi:hypothetical protein
VAYLAPEQLDGKRPRPRAGAAFIFPAQSRRRRHNEAVKRQPGTDVTCVIPEDREKP